jgi:hypothetical protein
MDQLSQEQISNFIDEGFVKIENAFPKELAEECRAHLWKATQCDPDNPATWVKPVISIPEMNLESFKEAANTNCLHNAFNQLVGSNWIPRETLGSFPIRFPVNEAPTDTGWHVDASFPGDDPYNYFNWRININSKWRALLMLFLFSDVSEKDAPTIIKVGSHLKVAKILEPFEEKGLSFLELAHELDSFSSSKEIYATGQAGTVYLCHPFLVHAAQKHRGTNPKFMAQPPLLTKNDFNFIQPDEKLCPVEQAIIQGIMR